jgi:hypothetical protein
VRFDKQSLSGDRKTIGIGLYGSNKQITHADLNCGMDVQFRLFNRENTILAPQGTDNHRHHLRNPDPYVAGRNENALLKITERNFCPRFQAVVKLLQLTEIIFSLSISSSCIELSHV